MIPKNIIQFWHDPVLLPEKANGVMERVRRDNPDCKSFFFSDRCAVKLLREKYPREYLDLYCRNKIPASRCDLARLIFLYEHGGFYLDVSFDFMSPLDELFDYECDLVLIQRDQIPKYENCPEKAHCINGIIGVVEKSPFIWHCISKAFNNLEVNRFPNQVNLLTGPGVINDALTKFEASLNIKKYSLKFLAEGRKLLYHRYVGFSNSWVSAQEQGVLDKFHIVSCDV